MTCVAWGSDDALWSCGFDMQVIGWKVKKATGGTKIKRRTSDTLKAGSDDAIPAKK